jgi:predicted patatin/cPLA2 family phospholipase
VSEREKRRALILAGGGLKVAFQAGVLQVWLDEADIKFDLADGASGGVFNLAMWCSGKSGTEIADAWRNTKPFDFCALNPRPWVALSSLKRFHEKVLPNWGVDWDALDPTRKATFNVYNFSRHELQTKTPQEMNDDWLLACVSLPMWFPPVRIDGDVYVDAIFATDANLEAAIQGGANELWVIWTVSKAGRWRNGFVNQYFQMIENAAVWRLKDLKRRIDASNAAGHKGEFGRRIELKILCAEVPLHYLLVFSANRLHEAVELGVEHARRWTAAQGIPLPNPSPPAPEYPTHLRFREKMRGTVAFGVDDPAAAKDAGPPNEEDLAVDLTVGIGGVYRFLAEPDHSAKLTGWVRSDALGGKLPIESGVFNLFVPAADPRLRKMLYRLFFRDAAGHMLTLSGEKHVPPKLPGRHPWRDTTTLFTRVFRGRVEEGDPQPVTVASGVIRITPLGLARQMLSFRASGSGRRRALAGPGLIARFIAFFLGTLARVYLRR